MLLLLRNLPAAPRASCGQAVCMLFDEAYKRIGTLSAKEMQVLAKICISLLGLPKNKALEPMEVANICLSLSKEESWGVPPESWQQAQAGAGPLVQDDVGIVFEDPGNERLGASGASGLAGGSMPSSSGLPLVRTQGSPLGSESSGADSAVLPRMTYSVKRTFVEFGPQETNCGIVTIPLPPPLDFHPSDVEPEKLEEYRINYQKFRAGDSVGAKGELSTVHTLDSLDLLGYMPDPEDGDSVAGQEAGSSICSGRAGSSTMRSAPTQQPSFVKLGHTGQDPVLVSEGSSSTSGRSSQPKKVIPFSEDMLPPPLDFMPKFIDLGKLSTFRADYQKFRAGNASGAKGEITTETTKEDEPMSQADEAWLKKLSPPLPVIPLTVSSRKLAAYRVSYQKFRAGETRGAKGEVELAVLDDRLASIQEHGLSGAPSRSSTSPKSSGEGARKSGQAMAGQEVSFSVKNTFVHIIGGQEEDSEQEDYDVKLPPSLDIIPDSIDPEVLHGFRTDYQKFRAGCASGARGEVSSLAALDLFSGPPEGS